MNNVTTLGIDLAKSVFQLHGADVEGCTVLRRSQMLEFFQGLPHCLIGMEACASAHYWARELDKFGHDIRLMQPSYLKRSAFNLRHQQKAERVQRLDAAQRFAKGCDSGFSRNALKGYVKQGKTDAADAEAICEAVSRPSMRFVPVKSEETQARLMTHKAREVLVRQQTQIVNAPC